MEKKRKSKSNAAIARDLGRKQLTKDEEQKFHDHVTKQGYNYHELVEEGYWLFHEQ